MFTPSDYEKTRDFWEAKGVGACGPCSIAVALDTDVQKVIDNWEGEYTGVANVGDIERELRKRKMHTRRFPGKKATQFMMPKGYTQALAFIQWGNHTHWIEAQKHTHWVYLALKSWKSSSLELYIFCNGIGWFSSSSQTARDYLKDGYVRSYIGIRAKV